MEKTYAASSIQDIEKPAQEQQQSRTSRILIWCRQHKIVVTPIAVLIMLLPILGLLVLRKSHAEWTSPGVYPSPQGYGAGDWSDAYRKAGGMVSKMTLQEMNNVTLGISDPANGCVGVSGGVPRLGFPGWCLQDAGNGVRNTDGVNGYASGLSAGASFNATLAYERAQFMGAEFKKKGVNVALGPVVGPIGRISEGGRNWEGFGADPYLNGILGAQSVIGLQESVMACAKHFIANEQETNRNPISQNGKTILSTSANIDDQTMHELYVWPFQDLVHAGTGSVMCSYNRLNNTYACENSKAQNGILKGELNFQGPIISDWNAMHSGIPTADGGMDMAMPTTSYWDNDQLVDAVKSGALNETRLRDMATRIIAAWYQFGQDDESYPKLGVGMPADLQRPHTYVDARDPTAKGSILQQAIEGHVLVKNVNGALPLNNPAVLSVFGYDAVVQASLTPGFVLVSGQEENLFPTNWQGIDLQQVQLADIASNSPLANAPMTSKGTLLTGGGSGSITPAYISSPYDALQERAYDDGTSLFFDFVSTDPGVTASSNACLVFINEFASEGWDRPGLADQASDELVSNVAASCNNTIVTIHNAGIRLVDAWIENPNVTAVIMAHLPGQDAGRAVVQLLYGDVSPSGRLPYTVAKSTDDYGDLLGPCEDNGSLSPQCDFSEGVNIDYRGFLAKNVTPRYAFGYGLTYSEFSYSGLTLNVNATTTSNHTSSLVYTNGTMNQNKGSPDVVVGGLASLFDSLGNVQVTVENIGEVVASEVAQLYIQTPSMTTRALRGFQKVLLQPGKTAQVTFGLRRKDLSSWDTVRQAWIMPKGSYQVFVGKSVLDVQMQQAFLL